MTMLVEPLSETDANKLAKAILKDGSTAFSKHAREEMEKDNLTAVDVTNVIRGGYCAGAPEFERGTWRYRFRTQKIFVVLAFRSETEMTVVTAWRVVR